MDATWQGDFGKAQPGGEAQAVKIYPCMDTVKAL
jgi:hypothetical protein